MAPFLFGEKKKSDRKRSRDDGYLVQNFAEFMAIGKILLSMASVNAPIEPAIMLEIRRKNIMVDVAGGALLYPELLYSQIPIMIDRKINSDMLIRSLIRKFLNVKYSRQVMVAKCGKNRNVT